MAALAETASTAALPFPEPHPFAAYLRTVGRGSTLGRPLDQAEAEAAFAMILEDRVEPLQLGAFLLVLRHRTEAPSELAGFVRATRKTFTGGGTPSVDLDWPSYADRHKQLPYFVLAAKLLAGAGVRVLMHGIEGAGPATTRAALTELGLPIVTGFDQAAAALDRHSFAYVPLEAMCPALARLFGLRPLLGLRTPVNSLARQLNPARARAQIQGVFHPTYLPLHRETTLLLDQECAVIFKGGGGEAQRNPDKPCRAVIVAQGRASELDWPAFRSDQSYPWRRETLEVARLAELWRGEYMEPAPVNAVIGTAAMALHLIGLAKSPAEAETTARALWQARDQLS